MKSYMKCYICGGSSVVRDAWAEWDIDAQEWVLQNVFDDAFCNDCETSTNIVEAEVTSEVSPCVTDDEIIAKARDIYAMDNIEIDGDPPLSKADDGAWVQAWVWVKYPEVTNE